MATWRDSKGRTHSEKSEGSLPFFGGPRIYEHRITDSRGNSSRGSGWDSGQAQSRAEKSWDAQPKR
jgi:hypothetical protein